MTTDENRMSDSVHVELNPEAMPPGEVAPGAPQLRRPADSASRAVWVDYVVALGADRGHVDTGTAHYAPDLDAADPMDPDADHYQYRAGGLTKDGLVELADRLGG